MSNPQRLNKKPCKSTPQNYAPRTIRFHLDNGTVVDVEAVNTSDAERQLKNASIDPKRVVRISFPNDHFHIQNDRQTA